MRFDLSDDQLAIERTIAEMLAARVTPEARREAIDGGGALDELWTELCDLGFAGAAVPAEHGGQGLGLLELGIVAEALGAAMAPVPFTANAAAALVLDRAGDERQRSAVLPGLAAGRPRGALSVLRGGRDPLAMDVVGAGTHVAVEDGRAWLVGGGLHVVPVATIDLAGRYGAVEGTPTGTLLGGDPSPALDAIEVLLAAELTGVAQRALDIAVGHARERVQFGRAIGSFQGVSHRCAAALVEIEVARSTWRYAAWTAAELPEELALASSTAKVAAAGAAVRATGDCLQVLGGIGFTWEHECHLLLRRARVLQLVGRDVAAHRERIADQLSATRIRSTA